MLEDQHCDPTGGKNRENARDLGPWRVAKPLIAAELHDGHAGDRQDTGPRVRRPGDGQCRGEERQDSRDRRPGATGEEQVQRQPDPAASADDVADTRDR